MAIVKFNVHEDFINELKQNYPDPLTCLPHERPILRITGLMRTVQGIIRHLYLVATMKDPRGDILKLEAYCGDIWGFGEKDKKTRDRYDEIHAHLDQLCEEKGLIIRSGILEEGNV